METNYISHSLIISIGLSSDTSSSNSSDLIGIKTIEGNYWTNNPFTTDSNGIYGKFIKIQ